MIARVRFRETNGNVECYSSFGVMGSSMGGQRPICAAAIREKLDQLEIEQLGKEGLVMFEPDEEFTLLRIAIPSPLLQEMKLTFDDSGFGNLSGEISRLQFLKHAP